MTVITLENAKVGLEGATKVASTLDKMAKAATELKEAGDKLATVDDILAGVKFFGTASNLFAGVGVAIAIVQVFSDEKSQSEKNADLIQAVSQQINDLKSHLDIEFDKLGRKIALGQSQVSLKPILDKVKTYREVLVAYTQDKADTQEIEAIKLEEIRETMVGLATSVTEQQPAVNQLLATFNASFGDEAAVALIGAALLSDAVFLSAFYCTVHAMQARTLALAAPTQTRLDLLAGHVAEIAQGVDQMTQRCRRDFWSLSDQLLRNRVFPDLVLANGVDFFGNAATVGRALRQQWPGWDWSVIVTSTTLGFDNHGVTSAPGSWRRDYFGDDAAKSGQPCKDNYADFVVTATTRSAPIYNSADNVEVNAYFSDLTLDGRGILEPQMALTSFNARKRGGHYFYCLKANVNTGRGVGLGYWSAVHDRPDLDAIKMISIVNQGTVQMGRILQSEINVFVLVSAGRNRREKRQISDTYYMTLRISG